MWTHPKPHPLLLEDLGALQLLYISCDINPQISQPLCHLERRTPLLIEDTPREKTPPVSGPRGPSRRTSGPKLAPVFAEGGPHCPPKMTAG